MSAKNSDRAKQHRTLPSLEKNSEGCGNNVNGRAMCKSRQSVKPTSTSSAMHSKKHSAASNDDQVINVNLTDPDDLLQKLENMSLTEEEENEILQQALEVNQALKRKLHHQQQKQRKPCSSSSESMRASAAAYGDHQRNPRSGPLMAQKPGNSGRKLSPLHTGSRQSSQIPKSSTNHRKSHSGRSAVSPSSAAAARNPSRQERAVTKSLATKSSSRPVLRSGHTHGE